MNTSSFRAEYSEGFAKGNEGPESHHQESVRGLFGAVGMLLAHVAHE